MREVSGHRYSIDVRVSACAILKLGLKREALAGVVIMYDCHHRRDDWPYRDGPAVDDARK